MTKHYRRMNDWTKTAELYRLLGSWAPTWPVAQRTQYRVRTELNQLLSERVGVSLPRHSTNRITILRRSA